MQLDYRWINQQAQIDELAQHLTTSAYNAVDTEFIRTNTLYPKLGLLQLNINQQNYAIDGLLDLTPIWSALFQSKLNIFHACSEDLEIIYQYSKQAPLLNILDTQVALSFLDYGLQTGYQAALEQILNIQIEKDEQCSNWIARPLTASQLQYAISDVHYLPMLAEQLMTMLTQKNLLDFVLEDCRHLAQNLANPLAPELAYLNIAHHRHSSIELMRLKQLCEWREHLAVKLNKPRNYILKNSVIDELAIEHPRNLRQLSQYRAIRTNILYTYGEKIIQLLNQLPEQQYWPQRLSHIPGINTIIDQDSVNDVIQHVANKYQIPSNVVMRKKWLLQLIDFSRKKYLEQPTDIHQLNPYLTGWRFTELTQPLIEIIDKDLANWHNDQNRSVSAFDD